MKHNFFVEGLVSMKTSSRIKSQDVLCEGCGDETGNKAKAFCMDCRDKLCEVCSIRCRKRKVHAHNVVKLGDELKLENRKHRGMYCEQHINNVLEMYCSECNVYACMVYALLSNTMVTSVSRYRKFPVRSKSRWKTTYEHFPVEEMQW